MQNPLIYFGKQMILTTYTEGRQTENLVEQRKKLKNNINCVKVTDGAMNL